MRQVISMARIANPVISHVNEIGSSLREFVIEYDVEFEVFEANLNFDDAVALWERDPSSDDPIRPYQIPERFVAPQLQTSGGTQRVDSVHRRYSIVCRNGELDTELDSEEIKARIWLRRANAVQADHEVYTPFVEVDV
ncbi:hypothetical protein QF037_004469 [Streptomyces canus]|nr:hypothetical protein [Streptomyces canus]